MIAYVIVERRQDQDARRINELACEKALLTLQLQNNFFR
jgi:hypothetical protein